MRPRKAVYLLRFLAGARLRGWWPAGGWGHRGGRGDRPGAGEAEGVRGSRTVGLTKGAWTGNGSSFSFPHNGGNRGDGMLGNGSNTQVAARGKPQGESCFIERVVQVRVKVL